MRMRLPGIALTTFLLVTSLGLCQDPSSLSIKGETKVPPYKVVRLSADGIKPKSGYKWKVEALDTNGRFDKDRQAKIDWVSGETGRAKQVEFVAPPGDYRVVLKTIWITSEDIPDWDETERIVTILSPSPVPPGPTPQPQPDIDPSKPAPIPLLGLRVMIIHDALKRSDLTSGQREIILTSDEVSTYLRTKTVVTPTNPDGAYRIVDFRQGFQSDEEWYAALKRPRTTLPWVIISNGKTGYEGPIPPDITGKKFIELVKKYEVAP